MILVLGGILFALFVLPLLVVGGLVSLIVVTWPLNAGLVLLGWAGWAAWNRTPSEADFDTADFDPMAP